MNDFTDERLFTWFYRCRSEFSFLRKIVWRLFGSKIEGTKFEDDGTKVEVTAYELRGVRLIWLLKIDGVEIKQ